jgi:hypothetical protein
VKVSTCGGRKTGLALIKNMLLPRKIIFGGEACFIRYIAAKIATFLETEGTKGFS